MDKLKRLLSLAEDALQDLRWEIERLEGKDDGMGDVVVTPVEDESADRKREAFRKRVHEADFRARQGGFDPDEYIRHMTDGEVRLLQKFGHGGTVDQNLAVIGAIWRRNNPKAPVDNDGLSLGGPPE